jgi:hypothetical protein
VARTLIRAIWAVILTSSLLAATGAGASAKAVEEHAQRRLIKDSDCTSQKRPLKWNGGLPTGITPSTWPRGTVVVCWVKRKIKDGDRHGDYYKVILKTEWKLKKGAAGYPAELHQAVVSSADSKDNVYSATKSFVSSHECSDAFSVDFGLGPFSLSTSPKICKDYKVSRYHYDTNDTYWKSLHAGKTPRVATGFVQKVREGVVPKFDFVFAIPRYDNVWNEAGGYWESTKDFKWISWSDK